MEHTDEGKGKRKRSSGDKIDKKEQKRLKKEEKELRKSQKNQNQNLQKISFPTLSIAVPGSIVDNAQSPALRTYLVGQIARAAAIFKVHEIVIFSETAEITEEIDVEFKGSGKDKHDPNLFMFRLLQYLDCPQYLRKHFFPMHKDLQFAGVLNPLDSPHHMRMNEWTSYREGVVTDRPSTEEGTSWVNAGFQKEIKIDRRVQPGVRVTVKMNEASKNSYQVRGTPVSPLAPNEDGIYWGYSVRLAKNLSRVFDECPFEGGYDLKIGTSERGTNIHTMDPKFPSYKHLIIVFGGVKGLESCVQWDEGIQTDNPADLFDQYVNVVPGQGSRTIRSEEAVLITLAAFDSKIHRK